MSEHDITHHIDRLKESFLCAAARGGRIDECASLLDLGADLEWPELISTDYDDHSNDTPLLASVRNGFSDVAALLLAHGADPFRCASNGDNVLHLIAVKGDETLASLFAPNAAALVNITNREGMTPVDVAVSRGHTSLAEFLSGLCEERIESIHQSTSTNSDDYQSSSQCDSDVSSSHDLVRGEASVSAETESSLSSNVVSNSNSTDYDIDEALHYSYCDEDTDELSVPDADSQDECYEEEHDSETEDMTDLAHSQSIELYQSKFALNEALQERDKLKKELCEMKLLYDLDDGSNLVNKSLAELTSLEERVKKTLDRIIRRKEELSASQEEERSCVICKEQPKTVLLMNCRHLCVCSDCGKRQELDRCPLCREIILERIDVFQ